MSTPGIAVTFVFMVFVGFILGRVSAPEPEIQYVNRPVEVKVMTPATCPPIPVQSVCPPVAKPVKKIMRKELYNVHPFRDSIQAP